MAVKDLRSNVITQVMGAIATLPADATTLFTGIIDNADYEIGVMFSFRTVVAATVASTSITVQIQESDDPTFAAANTTNINPDTSGALTKFIGDGDLTTFANTITPAATVNTVDPANPITQENRMVTVGVFSNKRYLKIALVDEGGNSSATIECYANQASEYLPVVEPDA